MAIELLLNDIGQTNSLAFYHKIRVEIKKLDAFFKLLEYCSKDFKHKKVYKAFNKVSQLAGKIRELQIDVLMLKKYFNKNQMISYRNYLHQQNIIQQQKFHDFITDSIYPNQNKLFEKVRPALKKVDAKKLDSYLSKKRKKINKILSKKQMPIESLHDLRKRLKMYFYTSKIILSKNQKNELNKNAVLLKLMGQWHDYRIFISHINKAIHTKKINKEESLQLENIKTKLNLTSEKLFNNINIALLKFKLNE